MRRLILHAPSVHTGGGLVLLQNLLSAPEIPLAFANLDSRALARVEVPRGAVINEVRPRAAERLHAEFLLAANCRPEDTVLCFHGMPPLFRLRGKVVVFLQNRNYLGLDPASSFDGRTRFRLPLERLVCRLFRRNVNEYIVQTPYMAKVTRAWHGGEPRIRIIPYLDTASPGAAPARSAYDFIYVADGEAHKNHRNLLAAWVLLAEEGARPSLALTLDARFRALLEEIEAICSRHALPVKNLGTMSREGLMQAYAASRALIFPSTSESFGLPLVEASRAGLPIIASELDYVRDVCEPAQTFDPGSPVSIARAVRRFLGLGEHRHHVRSGSEFIQELMQ